ncbi:MAG: hypothetical protein ACJ8C4_18140 [Gemmataceae bacterium]
MARPSADDDLDVFFGQLSSRTAKIVLTLADMIRQCAPQTQESV